MEVYRASDPMGVAAGVYGGLQPNRGPYGGLLGSQHDRVSIGVYRGLQPNGGPDGDLYGILALCGSLWGL